MYTIGQVSKMFGLPISTLRYYDRQGLFPSMERHSGIRHFSEKELETLRLITCLKSSGLEIKDIRQFILWCAEGSSTYALRGEFLKKQKALAEAKLAQMTKARDMLSFKCWFYEQAIKDGSDENARAMIPEGLPETIRAAYDNAHSL